MRIVVTGAAGFVGRALVRALCDRHEIIAIDHVPMTPRASVRTLIGNLCDRALCAAAFADPCDAIIHLATMPGGAAEADPAGAWSVNVEATRALIDAAAKAKQGARFLFASSIAVFGATMPGIVDDDTPVCPQMVYGGHKALMEEWIAVQSRRGAIDGLSLRLPGIVARPLAPSGMKSAYMSDLFHALRAGTPITLPVSAAATSWLLSLPAVVEAFIHALSLPRMPQNRRLTLPALRVSMRELIAEVAAQTGADPALVGFAPDPAIEAAFGSQPPLRTPAADALGFRHDGTVAKLVETILASLAQQEEIPS